MTSSTGELSGAPRGIEAALKRVTGWRDAVVSASGWPRAAIAVLAGLLSVLAFAPFFAAPVLFFTLPVLIWLVAPASVEAANRNGLWRAFKDGWAFGFGFFFAGLFWVGEAFLVEAEIFGWLLPFAVTLLPAGLALFHGAAAAAAHALWRPGVAGLLVMAVVFATAEWLRGHILTGFPWNVLGYALTGPEILMQSAGLVGIYGLTLWTIVVFASPLVLATGPGNERSPASRLGSGVLIALVPLLLAAVYGMLRLDHAAHAQPDGPRVRIVQPSVPQREKWMPEKQAEIFALHRDLSMRSASGEEDGLKGVALLVWPEAAMPFRPLEHPEALDAIGRLLPDERSVLVSGGLRIGVKPSADERAPPERQAFNSLMAVGKTGAVTAIYDKIHLVPFGEYLPFQRLLEAIGLQQLTKMRGGFTPGPKPRPVLRVDGLPPILGLICYEAIFPAAVVQGAERPGLLVNLTNDGWFGNTTGPRQHLHQARVRAVEEGLPMLRAANNGISAVIDANGRVRASLGLNARGVIDSAVPPALAPPPYARWGDLTFLVNALAFLVLARRWTS